MEAAFGESFADVRVHRDSQAGDFAADLQADAFTLGQHVFFGHGRYRPGSPEGRRPAAHELAHTLQQREPGRPAPRARLNTPATADAGSEAEAEAAVAPGRVRPADPGGHGDAQHARGRAAPSPGGSLGSILRGALSEILDPARLNEAYAENILRQLRADPEDRGGKIRLKLAGLSDLARSGVLDKLEAKLDQPAWEQFVRVLDQPMPGGVEGPPSAEVRGSAGATRSRNRPRRRPEGRGEPKARKTPPRAAVEEYRRRRSRKKAADRRAKGRHREEAAKAGPEKGAAAATVTEGAGRKAEAESRRSAAASCRGGEAASQGRGRKPPLRPRQAQAGGPISVPAAGGGGRSARARRVRPRGPRRAVHPRRDPACAAKDADKPEAAGGPGEAGRGGARRWP